MKQVTKHYRVYLYPNANSICNEMAMWAIKSNGTPEKAFTLQELEMVFKMDEKKFPASNDGYHCHLFNHSLTVDYTSEKRNDLTKEYEKVTTCVLLIEEIELVVLKQEEPPYLDDFSNDNDADVSFLEKTENY